MIPFIAHMLMVAAKAVFTAFTQTLTADEAGWSGYSMRDITTSTLSAGGAEVRVTFEAPASGSTVADHAAIGVFAGTNADTNATPVELKFSGSSGFTITNGAQIVSDWATLTTTTANKLVVIVDHNGSSGGTVRKLSPVASGNNLYKTGATYTQATPAGLSGGGGNTTYFFNKIEVR